MVLTPNLLTRSNKPPAQMHSESAQVAPWGESSKVASAPIWGVGLLRLDSLEIYDA